MPIRYCLIGAAGYIAPRHLRAMRDTGGTLLAATDVSDSVGVLDAHFPEARFFTEFERFEADVETRRRAGEGPDYVAICSPNHLHDAHMRFALRSRAHAICEKPLVLDPADLDGLAELEAAHGRRINAILQLRLHAAINALRAQVQAAPADRMHEVELTYLTSRGAWYHASWKGVEAKSGGIAANIGVHFFDMLGYIFGPLHENVLHHRSASAAAGWLVFERARVRWFLSVDRAHLPPQTPPGQSTWRSITVDGQELEFSDGFTDLHVESYRRIVAGQGFGLAEVRPSIEIVAALRGAPIEPGRGERHPILDRL